MFMIHSAVKDRGVDKKTFSQEALEPCEKNVVAVANTTSFL